MEFTVQLISTGVLVWIAITLNRTARVISGAFAELTAVNDALYPAYSRSQIDAERKDVEEQRARVDAKGQIRDEAIQSRQPRVVLPEDEHRFKDAIHEELQYDRTVARLRFLIEANARVRSGLSTLDCEYKSDKEKFLNPEVFLQDLQVAEGYWAPFKRAKD